MIEQIFVAALAVALVGFSGGAESPCYQSDLIVGGLGNDTDTIVPIGFVQIDGGLFDTVEQAQVGLYKGDAYRPVNRSETGLFVGTGY